MRPFIEPCGKNGQRHEASPSGRFDQDAGHLLSRRMEWMISDRSFLVQILRHLQMMLKSGKSLAGPLLQFGIVAALGITLEK